VTADEWAAVVAEVGRDRGLRYEPIGGINPVGGPAALCPGGTNRLTGQLAEEFWGAACDADEHETGGFLRKTVLPRAMLSRSHMPDLASVISGFSVESLEAKPEDFVLSRVSNRVQFESIEFNRRYLVTVPEEYTQGKLRELFSPSLIEWLVAQDNALEFGIGRQELWVFWRYSQLDRAELESGLDASGELFQRVRREMEEAGIATYPAGPWHAGMEPFPKA
jgi:hypothetical protein